MKRVVAFSLYGTDPKYHDGLRANIELLDSIYPDWELWVYAEGACDSCRGADRVYEMGDRLYEKGDARGMFWRYLAATEPDVDVAIFRDADSRINPREADAVGEWLDGTEARYHSMHDFRHHRIHPLLGGMWGVRGGLPEHLHEPLRERCEQPALWGDDQKWLEANVFDAADTLHHSSLALEWSSRPFRVALPNGLFVGQQFLADNTPVFPR